MVVQATFPILHCQANPSQHPAFGMSLRVSPISSFMVRALQVVLRCNLVHAYSSLFAISQRGIVGRGEALPTFESSAAQMQSRQPGSPAPSRAQTRPLQTPSAYHRGRRIPCCVSALNRHTGVVAARTGRRPFAHCCSPTRSSPAPRATWARRRYLAQCPRMPGSAPRSPR